MQLQIRSCNNKLFFLFLHDNICCGNSLEVPHWGTSNESPQHMFSCRKNMLWVLIRSVSASCLQKVQHMFSGRNKKNVGIFQRKKISLSEVMCNHLSAKVKSHIYSLYWNIHRPRQTLKILIMCCKMHHVTRVYTVCHSSSS